MSEAVESGLDELLGFTDERAADFARAPGGAERLIRLCDDLEKLALSNLGKAGALSDRLLHVADLGGDPKVRSRARRARAQALAYANRYEDALTMLSQAAELSTAAGNSGEVALAKLTTLHALARLGRLEEAVRAGEAARSLAEQCGDSLLAARADINTGVTYRMRDEPRKALENFARARPRVLEQPMILAALESNTAEAMLDLQDFEGARGAFESALAAFQRAGAARAAGIVEGNLADLAGRQGRLGQAIDHFERARRLMDQAHAPGDAARLAAEQAEVVAEVGAAAEASEMLAGAIPVLEEHKLQWESARARAALGRVLIGLGSREKAGEELDKAQASFAALSHPTGVVRIQLLRAQLLAMEHREGEARTLLREVVASAADRPVEGAAARLQLGVLALEEDDLAGADAEVVEAKRLASSLGFPSLLADCGRVRGRILRKAGDKAATIAELREAVAHLERLRGTLRNDPLRAAFLGERMSVYQDLAGAQLDAGNLPAAFATTERAKGRTLLDLLQSGLEAAAPWAGEEAPLVVELGRERAALNTLYTRLTDPRRGPQLDLAQWRAQTTAREQVIAALEQRLSTQGRFAPVFSEPAGLEEVRACLNAGEVLVEYVAEGGELSAIVLSKSGAQVFRRIARIEAADEAVKSLYFQLGRAVPHAGSGNAARLARLRASADEALAALDALLLDPIRSALADCTRLIVIPHGGLFAVPFHALRNRGRYLVESLEVVSAPSASLMVHLRGRDAQTQRGRALVIGVADEAAPMAEREAAAVAAQFSDATLLVGEAATVEAIAAAAPGASLVHIASHARFTREDPLDSGLRVHGGWLTARDILQLRLNGATVTLSGCDTGRAVVSASDELSGLVRALLMSGAVRVVMSLWSLHDVTASELMADLYGSRYAAGDGPLVSASTALAQTQRKVLAGAVHPVLWAPFVELGVP